MSDNGPMTANRIWPGYELTYRRDVTMVDVSGDELDPAWNHQDAAGHWHFVDSTKEGRGRLPTIRWVSEPCSMDHGDDCTAEGHYECLLCQEEIRPGVKWVNRQEAIPGPTEITLTVTTRSDNGTRVVEYWCSPRNVELIQERLAKVVDEVLSGQMVSQHIEHR